MTSMSHVFFFSVSALHLCMARYAFLFPFKFGSSHNNQNMADDSQSILTTGSDCIYFRRSMRPDDVQHYRHRYSENLTALKTCWLPVVLTCQFDVRTLGGDPLSIDEHQVSGDSKRSAGRVPWSANRRGTGRLTEDLMDVQVKKVTRGATGEERGAVGYM